MSTATFKTDNILVPKSKKKKGIATEVDRIAGMIFKEYRISSGFIQIDIS